MRVCVCVANRYSINSKLLHSANANYFPASCKRNHHHHHHHHRDHVPFAITAAVQIIMQRQFVKCAEINTVNYTYPAACALCVCVCSGCCCVNEMRRLPNAAKTHSDIAADNLTNTLTLDLHLRARERERETEKKSRKKTRSLEEAQFIHKNFPPSRPNSVCPSALAAIGGLPILSNPPVGCSVALFIHLCRSDERLRYTGFCISCAACLRARIEEKLSVRCRRQQFWRGVPEMSIREDRV